MDDFPYQLTAHAAQAISERKILLEWIARTVQAPQRTEPHESDPTLRYALARIPEYGDRVLRVVYNETTEPWRIVMAYFDRSQRNQL